MVESYFAFLDERERHGQALRLSFDVIDSPAETVRSKLDSTEGSSLDDLVPGTFFVELQAHYPAIARLCPNRGRLLAESQWFELEIDRAPSPSDCNGSEFRPTGRVGASQHRGGESACHTQRPLAVRQVRRAGGSAGQMLERLVNLDSFPDASESELADALKPVGPAEHVACYRVGQGNCCAAIREGFPVMYFDFGGGCCANESTYPAGMRFCFTQSPPIVLSHWDKDHWISGLRFDDAQKATWIVPRQKLGPSHLDFANKVRQRGKLLVWGNTAPSMLTTALGQFARGTGKGRNHSGIACLATLDLQSRGSVEMPHVLLPGDAAYRHVPGAFKQGLQYVVASHHGGNQRGDVAPVATGEGIALYSFGSGNTCGHPHPLALARHKAAGWKRRDTTGGHVLLGGAPIVLHVSCNGRPCDLKPAVVV